METRKQLRGNCQACGRVQAVTGTLISKHGYTVKDHWFQGICPGQHHAPMQHDRAATDSIVASIRAECEDMDKLASLYREGKAHPARINKYHYKRGEDSTMAWEDAAEWEQESGIKSAIWNLESRARAGRDFADMLETLANARHGTPLLEAKVEAAAAPISIGEQRKSPNGKILRAVRLQGQRVYWKDERGYGSWTGSSAWRKYERV